MCLLNWRRRKISPKDPPTQPPPDGWCILHLRFQQNKQPYLLPNT